jgi:hypothetical protein
MALESRMAWHQQHELPRRCAREDAHGLRPIHEALATVPRERLTEPGVVGEWSLRDVLAHFAGYERYLSGEVLATLQGRPATNEELYGRPDAPTPADDVDEDTSNAWVVARARRQPVNVVLEDFATAHHRLVAAVEACADDEFEDPGRFASFNGRSLASVLPNQCWAHYAQHLPDILRWRDASAAR